MATSVDVSEVGAKGAACFFEKLAEKQNREKKFEDEIRSEQVIYLSFFLGIYLQMCPINNNYGVISTFSIQ